MKLLEYIGFCRYSKEFQTQIRNSTGIVNMRPKNCKDGWKRDGQVLFDGGDCFIRATSYLTGKPYKEVRMDFLNNWKRYPKIWKYSHINFLKTKDINSEGPVIRCLKDYLGLSVTKYYNDDVIGVDTLIELLKDRPGKFGVMLTVNKKKSVCGEASGHLTVFENGHFVDDHREVCVNDNWYVRIIAAEPGNEIEYDILPKKGLKKLFGNK